MDVNAIKHKSGEWADESNMQKKPMFDAVKLINKNIVC